MSAQPLLEVSDLVVGYGATKVLKGVSLTVAPGEAVAVLGANGAGKSTLMKVISGLLAPWEGAVRFGGEDVTGLPAEERAALGIALAPEGRGIFATLSIEENLLIGATCLRRRMSTAERRAHEREVLDRVYGTFPVLAKRRTSRGCDLSGGQQQMLAIGRALMAAPKLLVLDEPCLGLAPKMGNEVYTVLRSLREAGQSLIVVEESSRRALDFVDRACCLKLGEKVLDGDAAEMKADELLIEAYFGLKGAER
ncbi:ABC transporter ATP-binding protein [Actinomadura chibensis]|uniref:ABC transporter ATP-binding protein n=1 Tax=Actinomadura chibensis TaxID=392828 RepID=A0A5D0NXL0_9ACTN|nr:ABC transporter ATP-binding protein [Actinomadura chibensis]TYB48904.1 ABC transporter ATP-binding protein [Actinomadura chibensis]